MTAPEQRRVAREIANDRSWQAVDAAPDMLEDLIAQALAATERATVERCAKAIADGKLALSPDAPGAETIAALIDAQVARIRLLAAPAERVDKSGELG